MYCFGLFNITTFLCNMDSSADTSWQELLEMVQAHLWPDVK